MTGLRERKKLETRRAIHDAAMRLFGEQGFAATTIDQIADAANISRATVFSYFRTKEDIVLGDAPAAIDALAAVLRERTTADGTIAAVRSWLGQLAGWIEPELVLQLRLANDVPAVGARRLQLYRDVERVVADALVAELGPDDHFAAQLAAASLIAALAIVEESAAARMNDDRRALSPMEIDALFDAAVAFAEAGISAMTRA